MKKSLLTVAVIAMLMLVLTVTSFAADASKNPAKILDKTTYAVTVLEDYDEDLGTRASVAAGRCTFELVNSEISGKAIKLVSGDNTAEATIKLGKEFDFRGYDGILFWVDMTGVVPSKNDATGIGVRFWSLYTAGGNDYMWTRNTVEPIVEDDDLKIVAYYQDGENWKETDQSIMNGERNQLPANYKGWVYIPFSSYITNVGPEGRPVAGLYGEDCVNKYMLLTGPYDYKKDDAQTNYSIIVDELQLVKLDVAQDGLEEALKPFRQTEEDTDDLGGDDQSEEEDPFAEDDQTTKDEGTTAASTTEADTGKADDEKDNKGLVIGLIAAAAVIVIAAVVVAVVKAKKK